MVSFVFLLQTECVIFSRYVMSGGEGHQNVLQFVNSGIQNNDKIVLRNKYKIISVKTLIVYFTYIFVLLLFVLLNLYCFNVKYTDQLCTSYRSLFFKESLVMNYYY